MEVGYKDEESEDCDRVSRQVTCFDPLRYPYNPRKTRGLAGRSLLLHKQCSSRETWWSKGVGKAMNILQSWEGPKLKALLQNFVDCSCKNNRRRRQPMLNYNPTDYALNFEERRPTPSTENLC